MGYTVKGLELADIDRLIEFVLPYAAESLYGKFLTADIATCKETFTSVVLCPDDAQGYIVMDENGKFVATAVVVLGSSFFKGQEGDVEFFYVSPECRGTGAARLLVSTLVDYAKLHELNVLHAGCHSGFTDDGKNDKLFSNLFRKFRFRFTGHNLHFIPSLEK